jgi:signal peptidase
VRPLALTALTLLSALVLVPAALGYERYVIGGGSMGGSLPRGSIAYERRVPVEALRVGDVITYTPPGHASRVTHRVASIDGGVLRTRGDANAALDPWRFRLTGSEQAVVRFHLPLAGFALAALAIRPVRMLAIGLPALLLAGSALRRRA